MRPQPHLTRVVDALGPLNREVIYVGGATVDLYITDAAAGPPRFTDDVDVIVDVRSRAEYHSRVEQVLRTQGFKPDMRDGAPICRYVRDNLTLDAMPIDDAVLGFSNRWYRHGFETAQSIELTDDLTIRILTAPCLLATKLEAFHGRGESDYLASHDLEDIIRLIDGRPELAAEVDACAGNLRDYLRAQLTTMLQHRAFLEAIPCHLLGDPGSRARVPLIRERLEALASD